MKRPARPLPTLAAFLATSPASRGAAVPPRPTGAALESAIEELLEELPEDFDEAQERTARVGVAWRVARAIAECRGFIDHDSLLAEVPAEAWSDPSASSYVQGPHAGAGAVWRAEVERASVALLPTRESAVEWAEVLWQVAVRLDILATLDGRLGVLSLLSALSDPAGDEWADLPDREAVLAAEEQLVAFTMVTATVSPESGSDDSEVASVQKARRLLTEGFGLAPSEVASLLALAQRRSLDEMPQGDALRSMQLLGLADLARRSASSLDLSSEIAARRLYAQVSGVTRSIPEDSAVEFLQVVKRVAARQDAEQLAEPRHVEALPAARRRTEEVQAEVLDPAPEDDDWDAEALREFDRENG